MLKVRCSFLLALAAAWPFPVGAQDYSFGPLARLEIWRHERLAQTRQSEDVALAPFTTDGCSGGMSASWEVIADVFPWFAETFENKPPWEECCVTHDLAYHLGGVDPTPEASYHARLVSDEALRACVATEAELRSDALVEQFGRKPEEIAWAFEFVGQRMFEAVRAGGAPCSGLSWRWGYGWPQCW